MSNNKQQTAVEWLWEIAYNRELTVEDWKQAKEMEKEQHSKTFNQGVQWMQYQRDEISGGVEYWEKKPLYFLDYYKEIYGGNK